MWIFTKDLLRPRKPESEARLARRERARAGQSRKVGDQNLGTGVVPFETTPEDRLLIKLRTHQRKVIKDGTAPTTLTSYAGSHLISMATRYVDGGREAIIGYVRYAVDNNHPAAVAWWTVWADLTDTERKIVSFDDVCAAAGVRPADFIVLLVKTAMDYGRDIGNLVAAVTHPKVVEAAALSAQRITGDHVDIAFKDRERLLQNQGIYPTPRGLSINVSANAQAAAAATNEPSVPAFARDMNVLKDVRRVELPAGSSTAAAPIDVPSRAVVPVPATNAFTDSDD